MKNKPMVIHSFIFLQNPYIIPPQHLLAYWWLGGGGQLFKCDRWSLVSGCCCCSFLLRPSHPQRAWDEPEPQYSSAEKPFVVVQSVFRRRASRPPLLNDSFLFVGFMEFSHLYLDCINNNFTNTTQLSNMSLSHQNPLNIHFLYCSALSKQNSYV